MGGKKNWIEETFGEWYVFWLRSIVTVARGFDYKVANDSDVIIA